MTHNMIIDYLQQCKARDDLKGGDGWRTTRDVADWTGDNLSNVRRYLWRYVEQGRVEVSDSNPLIWRVSQP